MSNAAAASHAASVKPMSPIQRYLWHVLIIIRWESIKLFKDPAEIFSRSVQPALWLLIFGQAMGRAHAISIPGGDYLAFLTPGILAQSITFVSIFAGLSVIWEKDMGLLQKILTTPIHRSSLVLGRMLASSQRALVQLIVILLLASLLRVHMLISPARLAGMVLMTMLGGSFFAGMSMGIAALVKTRERMMGIGQLITMPLFFASSALYPTEIMPLWLRVFSTLNPMSYLVDGLRGLLIYPDFDRFAPDALALACCSALALIVATKAYPRLLS